jgi:phosphatidylserine/phosphatidylglycerophosphate/cardiolipin synthase-like enzyme
VKAIAGTRAVLIAFDCDEPRKAGLLGFSIQEEVAGSGAPEWLWSEKVFKSIVPDPKNFQGPRRTDLFPVQTFLWSDYWAQPDTLYRFRVLPRYGTPAAMSPPTNQSSQDEINLEVRTEKESDGTHGVWFNRGAIAGQHFARKFGNKAPTNINDPNDPEVKWLSRGLLEACLAYIRETPATDALRVAAYEFTYPPVLDELVAATKRGVDVKIVYHDTSTATMEAKNANENALIKAGLKVDDGRVTFKRSKTRIPHNKFIVRLAGGTTPAEVWTGSTNFTNSGFLGQTNVGHRVADPVTARQYLDFWELLRTDPDSIEARVGVAQLTPDPDELIGANSIVRLFSPRANSKMLEWYGRRILNATNCVLLTAAFGINKMLLDPIARPRSLMRFLLLEKPTSRSQTNVLKDDLAYLQVSYGVPLGELYQMKNGLATSRRRIQTFELEKWFFREEHFRPQSSGFVFFVHAKFLLVDPLSDDPLVCSGSANFSSGSLLANDENMLLIRGNTRVADIYFTEFDRIFRHFFFRDVANELYVKGNNARGIFLDESDAWSTPYFTDGHTKNSRRLMFFASPTDTWAQNAAHDQTRLGQSPRKMLSTGLRRATGRTAKRV